MRAELRTFIKETQILPRSQHGLREGHSPETAIIHLIDAIATHRDKCETVVVASLDLAGAFDTLDHTTFINKLKDRCGISGCALRLIENYLTGRRQRTRKANGETSSWASNPWGVPQGSVLGPLLFVLFCADIEDAIADAEIVQYADDITLVTAHKDPDAAVTKMNQALESVNRYTDGNWLAVEPTKSQVLICTGKDPAQINMKCKIGMQELEVAGTLKIVGFHLDEDLSGEEHCQRAAGRADAATGRIRRATRYLRKDDRATLAEALAHPHLDSCQNALYDITKAAACATERAYNRSARMAARQERSDPAFDALGWARWERRRKAAREAMVAGVYYNRQPAVLWDLLPGKISHEMMTRSQRAGDLETPGAQRQMGEKAFRIWAPRVFNSIREQTQRDEDPQIPRDADLPKVRQSKQPDDEHATIRKGYYAYLGHKYSGQTETEEDGWIVVWTDGSRIEKDNVNKAGAGIFCGTGNPRNSGYAVSGGQTNQRAELTAFLRCIQDDARKLLVRTDSKYVEPGVKVGLQT